VTRHLPAVALLTLALYSHARAPHACAQELAAAVQVSREDSIRVHRTARSRQAAFERTRRNHLPWGFGGGGSDCDERIGRFCLTYSDGDAEEWVPPAEDADVVEARERLLETLSAAAATLPGDRWIAGHLVRYLAEAERFPEARSAAEVCRAEEWWCEALRGYAAHQEGAVGAADSAFSRMLTRMPEETRREWTDLNTILETPVRRYYRRLAGEERADFEERFWALADPLLQTAGNDLRSEHFSRNLLVELQDRSESTENIPWGSDLREIMLRFGAPSGWERVRPSPGQLHGELSMITHYPESDIDLLPPPELLVEDFDPTAGIWDEEDRRARATYPLPRGSERLRWFDPFEHQAAVFQGLDSALLVVAYELSADSLAPDARIDAALSVLRAADESPSVERLNRAGPRAVLSLRTRAGPALVSAEALAAEERHAGRARFGLDIPRLVPGVLAASDLLVLELEDSLPETRAAALRLARGSLRVTRGERVGVYWEIYAPAMPWPESLQISLRLVDADAGWLRRLAERAGVVDQVQPIRLLWDESAGGEQTMPRSLSLLIPEEIDPGRYTLELTITARGREPLVERRTLQVEL
jgi:hypothetical protein